jgi:cell wall-associated NlpC family hydrolase
MQESGLGRALSDAEMQHLKRGDLIFWKGHVAIARDADTIVHANAHHMATAIEDTKGAIARIKGGRQQCHEHQTAGLGTARS